MIPYLSSLSLILRTTIWRGRLDDQKSLRADRRRRFSQVACTRIFILSKIWYENNPDVVIEAQIDLPK